MYTTLIELAPGTLVLSLDGRRRGAIAEPDASQVGFSGPGFCYVYWLDRHGRRTTKHPEQVDRSELLLTAHVRQPVVKPQPAPPPEPSHIILDYIGRMFDALPVSETQVDVTKPLRCWHAKSRRYAWYEHDGVQSHGMVRVRWTHNKVSTALVLVDELVVVSETGRHVAPLADFLPDYGGATQAPVTSPDRTAQASIADHIAQMCEGLPDLDGKPFKVKMLKPATTPPQVSTEQPSQAYPQAPVTPGMRLKRGTKRTLGACSFCSCPSTDDNQPMWQLSGDRLRVRSCDGCLSQALQKAREAGLVDEQA
jgi:hypothetical protein